MKARINRNVYPLRGRSDEYGFWFSDDIGKWTGGNNKNSAERAADYRRRKKAGEVIHTRKHRHIDKLRNISMEDLKRKAENL